MDDIIATAMEKIEYLFPDNLLIDLQGKIVARNLRGEALHEKLKEV